MTTDQISAFYRRLNRELENRPERRALEYELRQLLMHKSNASDRFRVRDSADRRIYQIKRRLKEIRF